MKTEELTKLKEKIQTATTNRDKATGQLEQINKTLKDKYDCKTVTEAKTLIDTYTKRAESIQKKADTLEETIKEKIEELDV